MKAVLARRALVEAHHADPRVVDEHVDLELAREHLGDQLRDLFSRREVARDGLDPQLLVRRDELTLQLFEALVRRATRTTALARGRDETRERHPMPEDAPVTRTVPPSIAAGIRGSPNRRRARIHSPPST